MAEDDLDDEVDVEAEKAAEEAKASADAKASGKGKLMSMLFIAGALVVGLLGGGAGGYFIGSASATAPGAHEEVAAAGHEEAAEPAGPSIFVPLPKIRTNIASARCRGLYIDLEVIAAVGKEEDAAVVRAAAAHIKDGMTEYARTVTKEDLEGRDGSERLRANVQAVIDNAVQPVRVREVLFKEFVLQ